MSGDRAARTAAVLAAAVLLALGGWWWIGRSVPEVVRLDPAPLPETAPRGGAPTAARASDAASAPRNGAAPDPTAAEPPARLAGPWRLRVLLHDAAGAPLAGRVLVIGPDATTLGAASVPAGETTFTGLEGSVRVVAYVRDHAPWTGEPLEPPPSGSREITVVPDAGLAIEGVVLDQEAVNPVAGVQVSAGRDAPVEGMTEGPAQVAAMTGADGRFRLAGFAPGEFHLRAEPFASEAGGPRSAVAQAGATDVRIVLSPRCFLDIEAVDAETREPLVTTSLALLEVDDDGDSREVMTMTSVRAEPPPNASPRIGERQVHPPCTLRFRLRATGYETSPVRTLHIVPGVRRTVLRFEMRADPQGVATLRFHVRAEDGTPLSHVIVTRFGEGNSGWASAPLALEAGVAAWRTAPGRARLLVGACPGAIAAEPPFWLGVPVDLDLPRGALVDREIVLRRGGVLRVRGMHSPPDAARLSGPSGDRTLERTDWDLGGDGRGNYWSLGPFPAGVYRIEFPREEERKPIDAILRPDEVTEVDRSPPGERAASTTVEDKGD